MALLLFHFLFPNSVDKWKIDMFGIVFGFFFCTTKYSVIVNVETRTRIWHLVLFPNSVDKWKIDIFGLVCWFFFCITKNNLIVKVETRSKNLTFVCLFPFFFTIFSHLPSLSIFLSDFYHCFLLIFTLYFLSLFSHFVLCLLSHTIFCSNSCPLCQLSLFLVKSKFQKHVFFYNTYQTFCFVFLK